MFEKVIVGVDGSEPSQLVIEAAGRLSASTGATLILVHVVEMVPGRTAPHSEPADEGKQILYDAEAAAKALGAKVGAVQLEVAAGFKGAAGALEDAAGAQKADLIVVGTRGHGPCTGRCSAASASSSCTIRPARCWSSRTTPEPPARSPRRPWIRS
jgi:nucleotide-binding universal stress UspA family protein